MAGKLLRAQGVSNFLGNFISGLTGGGGQEEDEQQRASEDAAQRHQQIMTMLAMGSQNHGLGGKFMMRQLARQSQKLKKLEQKIRQRRKARRRRRREMMQLRHEPYWSAPPPRRPFRLRANRVWNSSRFY